MVTDTDFVGHAGRRLVPPSYLRPGSGAGLAAPTLAKLKPSPFTEVPCGRPRVLLLVQRVKVATAITETGMKG